MVKKNTNLPTRLSKRKGGRQTSLNVRATQKSKTPQKRECVIELISFDNSQTLEASDASQKEQAPPLDTEQETDKLKETYQSDLKEQTHNVSSKIGSDTSGKWENTKKALRKHFEEQEAITKKKPTAPYEVVAAIMKRLHESKPKWENHEVIIEPLENLPVSKKGSLKVCDIMSTKVVCVIDSTTVEQVAGLFNKRKIKAIPIVHYQSKHFMGLISMSDIFSFAFSQKLLSIVQNGELIQEADYMGFLDQPVRHFMNSKAFLEVSPDCTVQRACEIMLKEHLHHLVVTSNHKLKGIFSSFDALRILANKF